MSEAEFNSPELEKQQFIEDTISAGEEMRLQLTDIFTKNNIDQSKIKKTLLLDIGDGADLMLAKNKSIEEITATESNHPDGDIPEFTDEDDPLQNIPIHEIHTGILNKLSLGEKQKVQIYRDTAEVAINSLKNSGHSFDLVTRFNIFPYKLESRIEGIAREMLSVTNPGGVVIITTQEGDDSILNLLSQKLQNDSEISRIHVQPVSGDSKETPMEALGALAIIIQKN